MEDSEVLELENSEVLESSLSTIEHGTVAFKVLALVLVLLGAVLGFVAAVAITGLFRADLTLADIALQVVAQTPLLNCVACFMLAWFLNRTAFLFWTVAALVREMREVV